MKKLGRGSAIVGYLDEKLHFNILNDIDFDSKDVVFVAGTNGKTTITNTLNSLYKNKGYKVLSNLEGANLVSGISTSIIMDLKGKTLCSDVLLLEVDEKNVKLISQKIKPNSIILTNFFRDQLDRYFEINLILEEIVEVIKRDQPTLFINGQDPLILEFFKDFNFDLVKFSLLETKLGDSDNIKEIYYCSKCKQKLKYNYYHYAHIGDFYCPSCNFNPGHINHEFTFSNNSLYFNDNTDIKLNFNKELPLYLIINLCAILNFGLEKKLIDSSSLMLLEKATTPKGRNNNLIISNKEVYLTLAKNVVGMEQTINHLLNNYTKIDLLIAFNDNYADSKDVSWIWNVNFRKLFPIINKLYIVGLRKGDMKLRFLYDDFDNIKTFNTIQNGIDEILKEENPVIISNYTPLREINIYLHSKIKKEK